MTNAHVVAGVSDPSVEINGDSVAAEVVHYDPDLDVAVLALDTTGLPTLSFDTAAEAREGVAILGYPQDGPYDVQVGRIRAEQRLRSPDIYGDGSVIRVVFSLRGLVRPGNSGGPIVSSAGDVVGVVFAASVTDPDTGYALTADQVGRSAVDRAWSDGPTEVGDPATAPANSERSAPASSCPLRARGISLPWLIARSGPRTCFTFRTPMNTSRAATSR